MRLHRKSVLIGVHSKHWVQKTTTICGVVVPAFWGWLGVSPKTEETLSDCTHPSMIASRCGLPGPPQHWPPQGLGHRGCGPGPRANPRTGEESFTRRGRFRGPRLKPVSTRTHFGMPRVLFLCEFKQRKVGRVHTPQCGSFCLKVKFRGDTLTVKIREGYGDSHNFTQTLLTNFPISSRPPSPIHRGGQRIQDRLLLPVSECEHRHDHRALQRTPSIWEQHLGTVGHELRYATCQNRSHPKRQSSKIFTHAVVTRGLGLGFIKPYIDFAH